jgi:transposase-like protein
MSTAPSQNSEPSTLTPVQAQVVLSLVQGATVTAAARAAGLHRTTVYHWLNTQPAFETAINQARAEYILTLRDELKTMSGLALATLRSFLETNDTPPGVRLKAALAVLQRPDFPVPGWRLPEPTGTADQEKFMQNFSLIEMDYKQLRYEQALGRGRAERENESGDEIPPAE